MAIIGIESLIYGVPDVAESTRFFDDFGLKQVPGDANSSRFVLPEGSHVILRHIDDPALPASDIVGHGVREVIWGVDTPGALQRLASSLGADRKLRVDSDGTVHFLTDTGIAMGLRLYAKKPVVSAPELNNAPGQINRLNQHRRWRQRAYPKTLAHVVFSVPNFQSSHRFMCERLGFCLTDEQTGFGMYLRADGTNNHHSLLFLNANIPLPGMDGKLRFHHANFAVEDLDELMVGANHMARRGWEPSHLGLGRHRIDSALFYYMPCPAGGEAEYGADSDYVDDSWVPRQWPEPMFAYSHFVHNLPDFLRNPPAWKVNYLTDPVEVVAPPKGHA